jgi:type IV pilus assembly protein PilO
VKRQLPLAPVIGIAIVIVAAVVYLILVRPVRAESSRLDGEIAELETKIASARLAARPAAKERVRVADLFELSKAMPDQADMAGIVLELNAVAEAAGIRFEKIEPRPPVLQTGYSVIPISLTFEGSYYDLSDFLFRLRNLVAVRDGRLSASGRLFTVDALDMHQAATGFPSIDAVITVSAFIYGGGATTVPGTEAPAPTAPVGETAAYQADSGGEP